MNAAGPPVGDLLRRRDELQLVETRTSFWRKLIQGRIDVLAAATNPAGADDIASVISTEPTRSRRAPTVTVYATTPAPDLPGLSAADLTALFNRAASEEDRDDLLMQLRHAEEVLSAHRASVQQALDDNLAQLGNLYLGDPAAVVSAWTRQH